MKAITLTQPWATLVAIGAKRIETRSWPTSYRGPLAIHAAKGWTPDDRQLCHVSPFVSVLQPWKDALPDADKLSIVSALPHGVIVAVVHLETCWRFAPDTWAQVKARSAKQQLPAYEAEFGDYTAGRFGFVLGRLQALAEPVAARGMQQLWTLPDDVADLVNAQRARGTP